MRTIFNLIVSLAALTIVAQAWADALPYYRPKLVWDYQTQFIPDRDRCLQRVHANLLFQLGRYLDAKGYEVKPVKLEDGRAHIGAIRFVSPVLYGEDYLNGREVFPYIVTIAVDSAKTVRASYTLTNEMEFRVENRMDVIRGKIAGGFDLILRDGETGETIYTSMATPMPWEANFNNPALGVKPDQADSYAARIKDLKCEFTTPYAN